MAPSRRTTPELRHPTIRALLRSLRAEEAAILRASLELLVQDSNTPRTASVWPPGALANSYWILLLSGIDQTDELLVATELLLWQHFSAKSSAQLVCVQSSERALFKMLGIRFSVTRCPTLLVSDNPDMDPAVRLESPLLHALAEARGGLRKVLTEVHALIEQGTTIQDVAKLMQREEFFRRLKLAYTEAKSFVSLSVEVTR